LLENKTNAFENKNQEHLLPNIIRKKHDAIESNSNTNSNSKSNGSNASNASVSGSQEESEGEQPNIPLPQIKKAYKFNRQSIYKENIKKIYGGDKQGQKAEILIANKAAIAPKKKFNEDLKVDKAKFYKKSQYEIQKQNKKKKN